MNEQLLANVTAAYIEAIEFTDMGPDSDLPDNLEIADETQERCKRDCRLFIEAAGELLDGAEAEKIGHDFWLTRNGHGCGFWDGDWPEEIGAKLTELSERFSPLCTYQGVEEDYWYLDYPSEDFVHTQATWRAEVTAGNVLSGYYDWMKSQIEQEAHREI